MARKNVLRLRYTEKFTSAGVQTLYSSKVEAGRLHCYQSLSFRIDELLEDGTGKVTLFVDGHGYQHQLKEFDPVNKNTLIPYTKETWLHEGERLGLELNEGQANVTVAMYINGYWQEVKDNA